MKKIVYVVLAAAMLFTTTSVSAMTESELAEKLTKTYEINGVMFSATNAQKVEIERYFRENEVPEADLDFISKKFDEALAIIEKGDATSIEELTSSEKDQIVALFNEVSEKTKVRITLENGKINVYGVNGGDKPFTVVTDEIVRYTDGTNYLIALAGAISLVGVAAIVLKVKRANAK